MSADDEVSTAVLAARLTEALREGAKEDATPADVRTLDDGSRILFTTSRNDVDLLHFVATPTRELAFVTATDVAAGAQLFDESPIAYVCTLAAPSLSERIVRSLLPPGDELLTVEAIMTSEPSLPSPSIEWLLTYALLTRADSGLVDRSLSQLPKPAGESRSARMRAAMAAMPQLRARVQESKQMHDTATTGADRKKTALLHAELKDTYAHVSNACMGILPWVAAIRRRVPDLSVDDILCVFGIVCVNALDMLTPITGTMYGSALYTSVAHMRHSCEPTARLVFVEDGRVVVEAVRALPAGTTVTVRRFLRAAPISRCVATMPVLLRDAVTNTLGMPCICNECTAAITWLRASASRFVTTSNESSKRVLIGNSIEKLWTSATTDAELAAVAATLPPDSMLRSMLTGQSIMIACMSEQLVGDLTTNKAATQAALLTLFRTGAGSVASVTLAQLIMTTAWNTMQPSYGCLADDVVDAAVAHARRLAPTLIGTTLCAQGATPAQCEERVRAWQAQFEYANVAIRASTCMAELPVDGTNEERRAALLDLDARPDIAPLVHAVAASVGPEAASLHLHCEQLFSPHVGYIVSLTYA